MDLVDVGAAADAARGRRRGRLVSFSADGRSLIRSEVFLEVGVPALRSALDLPAEVIVMDELGRFELRTPEFLGAVREALDSSIPVAGVLKDESNPFLDEVRRRQDTLVVPLVAVDAASREAARAAFTAALDSLLRRARAWS
jgi:nucleoside-triphosphatase